MTGLSIIHLGHGKVVLLINEVVVGRVPLYHQNEMVGEKQQEFPSTC